MTSFTGKILEVDLTEKEVFEETLEDWVYRKYLGGLGLGAWYLSDTIEERIDSLGPKNVLGFVPGLLNGISLPLSGRLSVVAKSPLTGTWGDANVGGYFGTELKKLGYDAIFIRGKSNKPIYLNLSLDGVNLFDAGDFSGKNIDKTIKEIKKSNGEDTEVAAIGLAGEGESLISSIVFNDGRAAARSGLGAVMGSKNLKAISLKPNREKNELEPEERSRYKEIKEDMFKELQKKPHNLFDLGRKLIQPILPWFLRRGIEASVNGRVLKELFSRYGTSISTSISTESGDAPCKNWKGGCSEVFPFKEASKISDGEVIQYQVRDYGCATCPVSCGGIVEVKEGSYRTGETKKPEYETLAAFGSMTLNNDIESIIKCNQICDNYGLDTISTGSSIAFAIECYENGLIKKEDTGGIELQWGDDEAIVELTKKIANEEDIGALLSNGVKEAAEKIGEEAEKYAMHVHGQEVAMHDPRLNPSFGTAYVTDPAPGRHTKGGVGFKEMGASNTPFEEIEVSEVSRKKYSGKGQAQAKSVKIQVLLDSLGICLFLSYFGKYPLIEAINAINNWELSKNSLLLIGERIQTIRQCFNIRQGIEVDSFSLPERIIGRPPLKKGPTKDVTIDIDTMKQDYYKAMNWKKNGQPTKEKLKELDIHSLFNELTKH